MVKRSRTLPHLYLRNNGKKAKYTSASRGGGKTTPPYRNRKEHAEKLERKIGEAIEKARQQLESRLSEIAVGQPGFYLEFEVTKDDANAYSSLADRRKKLELVSVKPSLEQEDIVKATVFVPESATDFFQKKVEQYCNKNNKPSDKLNQKKLEVVAFLFLIDTKLNRFIFLLLLLPGRPKNEKLITRLENVEIGTVESLFTDDFKIFPQNGQAIWWEVWLRRDQLENFQTITERLEITTKSAKLESDKLEIVEFPERIVVLAMANVEAIEQVIKNSDTIAELRIAKDTPSFFFRNNTY
ncbi:hypothetical protein CWATWH0402_1144 [Crocosphaera watsonii WH 0402]|uniref:Uncharacterized protein n=1 Tax=Crocosphaera watsonii WH 0402 TaxID=1284629 RepID=T2JJ98_CROWT|nr:hypothetical protein [Crocosphaera watsonii]CCQ65888.1 hypothetical protein CWATWH0402_1144 [Crocosphaera watsonii WH 0402]